MSVSSLAIGLVPVLLFLGALVLLDSYKLMTRRSVLAAIAAGCVAAALCYVANRFAIGTLRIRSTMLTLIFAPSLEETVKAFYVVAMIRLHRVGFMVDAGILGFAVGTGFALVENVSYAGALQLAGPSVWLVRGLGTAVMHGSATAIVGIVSKDLTDRRARLGWLRFVPGLAIAIAAHSAFNHLDRNPLLATAFLLLVMPLLVFLVFERSERVTRDWLGTGLDLDVDLLEQILNGELMETRVGCYLHSLRERFAGPVVADMLCLLRIHLELSARAKGMMIARAAGIEVPADPDVRANFDELRYLEKSIGPTGRIAILPFVRTSSRDLWHIHALEKRNR